MELPRITDNTELRGKRVLVRASLNVPIENGVVQNAFRLESVLPTLRFLREAGARTVVMGHIGRDPKETLEPVCAALEKDIHIAWHGGPLTGAIAAAAEALADGDMMMVENVRSAPGETENDEAFAKLLASFGDIYVNDAFADSHRAHASIVGVPRFLPSYAGITFAKECEELGKAFEPQTPSLFLLGGAKFETKLPLIERFAGFYTHAFVGGALANDIWKAQGLRIGRSKVSDIDLSGAPLARDERLLLPTDVTVADERANARITTPDDVRDDEIIYDAGPKTVAMLAPLIAEAKTIVWNGPLGYFEGGYDAYTKECATLIAKSAAHSIIGGGDTVSAIEPLGLNDRFGFVSTGGGAMLVFLEKGTLPGIDALRGSK
jgi:3-phosphoglycerate kinase